MWIATCTPNIYDHKDVNIYTNDDLDQTHVFFRLTIIIIIIVAR